MAQHLNAKNSLKMQTLHLKCEALVILSFISLVFASCGNINKKEALVESRFLKNAENWKITGDANGSNEEQAEASYDGGVQDGYIHAKDDAAGGTWYFSAPQVYLGDKSNYYGAILNFSLFQHSAMNDQFENNDVVFKNGEKMVTYTFKNYPEEDWTAYSITIDADSDWMKGNFDSETPATREDIEAVLANVTEFWIRGEYEGGSDEGGLDEVEITKN